MKTITAKTEFAKSLLLECLKGPDYHMRGSIIQRKKDNPEMKKDAKVLKRYTFDKPEDFDNYKDEILEYVERYNARFYLNPNVKSYQTVALETLQKIAELLIQRNYEAVKNAYDSVGDSNAGIKTYRLWLIDIDMTEETKSSGLADLLLYFHELGTYIHITPTPNGYHLLVSPHKRNSGEIDNIEIKNKIEITYKINSPALIYWKGLE